MEDSTSPATSNTSRKVVCLPLRSPARASRGSVRTERTAGPPLRGLAIDRTVPLVRPVRDRTDP